VGPVVFSRRLKVDLAVCVVVRASFGLDGLL
jgi:hypothetical protein